MWPTSGIADAQKKTLIRRSDIEKLFDEAPAYKKRKTKKNEAVLYYTTKEIQEKFKIEKKTIYRRCKLYDIPKIEEGNRVYYNRALIDKYFAELIEEINPDIYYTTAEVMEKFGMSRASVASFALRHNIPRINRHHDVYYSRAHIEHMKKGGFDQRENYYSVQEAMERFSLSRDSVYNYAKYNKVRKTHYQRQMYLFKEDFDRIMLERLHRKPNDHN